MKGAFWDQRARFALALFDQIYANFQQDIQNVPVFGVSSILGSAVVNSKEVEIRGLEAEVTTLVQDNWKLGLSFALNDAKYNDFKNFPCKSSAALTSAHPYNTCDLTDDRLPMAPLWSGVLSSNYSMPAFDGADWYFNTLLNAKSSQIDKVTRNDLTGYATVDFFFGLRASEDKSWDTSLWIKNAFDRRVVTRIVDSTGTNPGLASYYPTVFNIVNVNPPRQVGVTGTYRF